MRKDHPNCRCTTSIATERDVAPRAIARALVCFGGPWDGERKLLEADEAEIVLAGEGHYIPVASSSGEQLRWRV